MNDNKKAPDISTFQRLAAIAVLFIAISAAYFKTLDNPFIWDDIYLIKDNYFIRDTGNLKNLFNEKYFSQPYEISYRPVTTLTYFIDYARWKEYTGGYHFTNLILHFLSTLLVLAILSRLTRRFALSAGVALLFALHPIHTETINLITFREDILCLLFAGSSFLLYIRYRDRGGAATLILSLVAAVLAMFSKETAVVLPAAILFYEYLASEKLSHKAAWLNTLLFSLPVAFFLYIRFGPMKGPAENIIYHNNSVGDTAIYMIQAMARYLNLLLWPAWQCVDQPFTEIPSLFSAFSIAAIILIVAIVILAFVFYLKRKPVLFGFIWLGLFILPVSNIIPIGVIMAERYLYIPSVGFFIALAFILDLLFISDEKPVKVLSPSLLAVLICITASSMFLLTTNRNKIWDERITFWENACECSPRSARSAVNLGISYLEEDRLEEASITLVRAVRIASRGRFEDRRYGSLYRGLSNLGIVAARQGRQTMAVKFFKEAVEIQPNAPLAHLNLGIALIKMGRFTASETSFRNCLIIDPNNQHAHLYLAVVLHQTGRRREALKHCDDILKMEPGSKRALRLKERLIWELQYLND
ncbi:tetratricopeptide repeat protein [bacterium]